MPDPSSDAVAAGSSERAPEAAGWFEAEPAFGSALGAKFGTLGRRARGSWRVWVPAAVALACLLTWRRARQSEVYSVTAVFRVVEGVASGTSATALTVGQLRVEVDARAFTSGRLLDIMRRHVANFPDAVDDPSGAVAAFRDLMDVAFEENGFAGERLPGDPARSTLISVSFSAGTPELAWSVAHELGEALVESSQEGQLRLQGRRQEAARDAVKQAAADYDAATRAAQGLSTEGVRLARDRLLTAQAAEVASNLSANAVAEHQVLRFDVVDAGLMPTRTDKRGDLLSSFIVLLAHRPGQPCRSWPPPSIRACSTTSISRRWAARCSAACRRSPRFRDSRDSGVSDSGVSTAAHDVPRPPRV